MNSKHKIIISVCSLALLSASCNIFSQPTAAGLVKTVNGGADWQFINKLADNKGSLSGLNISTIAADPKKADHIFAGSYNVGLYESNDSGNTWNEILSKIAIYDFSIDPTDSKHIYVAGFYADHGKVLATEDGGKSWQEIFNDASAQNAVRTLAINPANSKEIVIGTTAGTVIKSTDGGASWKLQGEFNNRVNKILWQPSGIYVLFRDKGLFKSTDGGDNFSDISSGLKAAQNFIQSTLNTTNGNTFNQFAISPVNASLLYVTSGNGLYKSQDGGSSWQKMPVPVVNSSVILRSVSISPSNDSTVYISAGATVYKSLDGGQQWKTQSVQTAGYINYILADPQFPQIAYAGIYVAQ